ncbi:TIGR00341 family protein [bacterium]|nr:TIGR00341 family protein [bacterium]|tara:strand:+ start:1570 stop:2325 length:756 start_codon:yes stop_codon:yes gene_type:complete
MSIFARFQSIEENDKAAVVRKLMENSTPDFDFFYITGLAVLMATFGLLADSPSIVIGSMLIAPVLYPILGVALGLVMSNPSVLGRSTVTLTKSFAIGVGLATIATVLFNESSVATSEVLARTEPSLLYFLVAIVAGAAVSFTLGQPEWSETLPGIAISVALIPPLAVVGIGLATLDIEIVSGSLVLLGLNFAGIVFSAMVTFSLMNLYEKQHIAESTIKKVDERLEREEEAIAAAEEALEEKVNGTGKPVV